MIREICEKCGVDYEERLMKTLYSSHRVCIKCAVKWNKTFFILRDKHPHRSGWRWRKWEPTFIKWLKNDILPVKVVFT